MADCEHLMVTRGVLDDAPIWTCNRCADQFVPASLEGPAVGLLREVRDHQAVPTYLRATADQVLGEIYGVRDDPDG